MNSQVNMEYVIMKPGGPTFSRIIQGFWRLMDWGYTEQELVDFLHFLYDLGITTWDNADIYGDYQCEQVLGNAFKKTGLRRTYVQIITKCGIKLISKKRPEHHIKSYDTTKEHIIQSVENSLTNLQTDYIDLLLIHRPDPLMNADEVAETFYKLKKEGKVLNFGVSNFTIQQFSLLQSRLDFPLITNQIEFSPYNVSAQHTGLLEFLQEKRVKPTIWSPFAGGRVFHGEDEMIRRVRDVLNQLKGKYEAEIDQLLLAWYLKHPVGMLPILGSGKRERIESAIKALSINLEREDWFRIWEAINGVEVP